MAYKQSSNPFKKIDNESKQKEIKSFIKSNMNKMSDVDLMKKIRKMSDNKTEYNWNNKSGKVESHPVKGQDHPDYRGNYDEVD
tara:strand:- start:198 stop:446 length:249 start_codon:yes stop_codon:yes gene_type:complete